MKKKIYVMAALALVICSGLTLSRANSAMFALETPLAGISLSLDKYVSSVTNTEKVSTVSDSEKSDSSKTEDTAKTIVKTTAKTKTSNKAKKSSSASHLKLNLVYDRLGVANVKNYLNVRKAPKRSAKIVGKMTKNSGCHVYKIRKGWAKIVSGKVKGWVLAKYLLTDSVAEKRAKRVATLRATVTTETLNVRALPSTDARIYDLLAEDEEYTVGKRNITSSWLKKYIKKHATKKDLKGVNLKEMYADCENWSMLRIDNELVFVSKDFIKYTYNLNRAVKIGSSSGGKSSDGSSGSGSSVLSRIASYAMQFLGNRYVWGGTSLTNGTDCSGFVMRIYEHFGYSLPRTSSAQAAATTTVSSGNVRVGDLFFYGNGSSVSHVALYIGNGQIIHASNARDGIKISNAYYRQPIKIGRVIN